MSYVTPGDIDCIIEEIDIDCIIEKIDIDCIIGRVQQMASIVNRYEVPSNRLFDRPDRRPTRNKADHIQSSH